MATDFELAVIAHVHLNAGSFGHLHQTNDLLMVDLATQHLYEIKGNYDSFLRG
jgi:hypothetical protein